VGIEDKVKGAKMRGNAGRKSNFRRNEAERGRDERRENGRKGGMRGDGEIEDKGRKG
jgi:hypothetical protein